MWKNLDESSRFICSIFSSLVGLWRADLYPISIYIIFSRNAAKMIPDHIVPSPVAVGWSFRLWRWNMTFSDTEMMDFGRKHATNIYNTRSLIRTLTYVLDILQTEEVFTVEEYKHTQTVIAGSFKNPFLLSPLLWQKLWNKFCYKRMSYLDAMILRRHVFSCKFCEIFKNAFLTEHLRTTASGYWSIEKYIQIKAILTF